MSVLRSLGKSLGGFLFTTGVALLIVSIALVSFTSYNNLKPIFTDVIESSLGTTDPEVLQASLVLLRQQCVGKERVEFQVSEGNTIMLECSKLNEQNADLMNLIATSVFDKIYYEQYECSFLECVMSGETTVFVSAYSNAFFQGVQFVLLVVAVIGLALILTSAENWPDRLKTVGIQMIVIGIPYFLIDFILTTFIPRIAPQMILGTSGQMSGLLDSITAPMKVYFLYFLVAGIVITAAGYIWAYKTKGQKQKKR